LGRKHWRKKAVQVGWAIDELEMPPDKAQSLRLFPSGQSKLGETVMKKDTQQRPGVSKSSAKGSPLADPPRDQTTPRRAEAAANSDSDTMPSITLSARYIDSRLKQFCWR
jgi:hypothetical protein